MGYWSRRKYDQADTAFHRALRLDPDFAPPHLALALLPFGRLDRDGVAIPPPVTRDSLVELLLAAGQHHRQAYLLDPLVDPGILRYIPVNALLPRPAQMDVRATTSFLPTGYWWEAEAKLGIRALIEGRPQEALRRFDRVRHDPMMARGAILPDIFIWYYALAAMQVAHFGSAAAAFRELAQRALRREAAAPLYILPSARADYLYFFGVLSARAGDTTVAREALKSALELDVSLYQAHSRLADLAEAGGDLEETLVERKRAIEVNPDDGSLQVDLGVSLLQAGRAA
jgi:tetratricopeptide (TPR) repeat protein